MFASAEAGLPIVVLSGQRERLCLIQWLLQAASTRATSKTAAETTAKHSQKDAITAAGSDEWEPLPVDARLGVYRRRKGNVDKLGKGAYGEVFRCGLSHILQQAVDSLAVCALTDRCAWQSNIPVCNA